MNVILMEEGYWANCQLSIARYYGGIRHDGKEYVIVNKYGITLIELSSPLSKHYVDGNRKAIEPGEPADLVDVKFLSTYRKVGRDMFIKALKAGCSTKKEIVEFSKK